MMTALYRFRRWRALRKARREASYWFEYASLAVSAGDLEVAKFWRGIGFQMLKDELDRWPEA